MAHHTVTLNWGGEGFRPDTDVLPVATGDTISFQLGIAPPGSTFLIAMDSRYFLPAEVKDSNTTVTVVKAATTQYSCHLFDQSGIPLSSQDQAGAGTRPGRSDEGAPDGS
jgi:hypothetical protein